MIRNTLPDKSGNPESLENNHNSSKAFQLMCLPIVGEDLLRVFYRLFYLEFSDSNDQ